MSLFIPPSQFLLYVRFSTSSSSFHCISLILVSVFFIRYRINSFSGALEPWLWWFRIAFKNPGTVSFSSQQGQGNHHHQLCQEGGGFDEQVGSFNPNILSLRIFLKRFECGFFGYRGLSGSSSRRPSEIVEKILHTLKERERELRRKNSALSWTTTSSYGASAIPSRFRLMDPQRPTFESIVEAVVHRRPLDQTATSPRTFRSIARSVLSAENREWREGRRLDAGE